MKLQHNDRLVEKLAAEYALGTLKAGARRRFEKMLAEHAVMRRAVAEWQDRLQPLAEFSGEIRPSPRVWQAIELRLNLRTRAVRAGFWRELRDDLIFWRRLGLVSTVLTLVLAFMMLAGRPDGIGAPVSYIATLTDDKAQPAALVTGDAKGGSLVVKLLAPQAVAADKSLELWAVPKQGAPRSLGLLAADGSISLPLPERAGPETVALLAVSLEPKGGSPDPKGPTGPILLKGAWLEIPGGRT